MSLDASPGAAELTSRFARELLTRDPALRRYNLVVFLEDGNVDTHRLPERGEVVIGRQATCGVRIDHPTVSRQHALLVISDSLTLRDLGSTGGTRINGRVLADGEVVTLGTSELIQLGAVVAIVQPRAVAPRPRRVFSHGQFEGILEEECARARHSGEPLALLRLHLGGPVDEPAFLARLFEALRPGDHVARYGPDEYEVLLPRCPSEETRRTLGQLDTALRQAGMTYRSGVATFSPEMSPEGLMARACAAVSVGPAGAPSFVRGLDPAMARLERLVERMATGTISVLILGETGVGKEVLAERVHKLSPRATQPLVKLNCAAFSGTLLESELFGHEKGAYTGADQAKPGLLETANGGTVFLDEIGDLSLALQVKLLRVLEERQLLRVGGLKPRAIDVRFIAATHHDLEAEVESGQFRRDLYYRLNGVTLLIPPLRERPAELEPLCRSFIEAACAQSGRASAPQVSPEAMRLLREYGWPGNVRELRNTMERAVLLCQGDLITPAHLPTDKMGTPLCEPSGLHRLPAREAREGLAERSQAYERQLIVDALERCQGNQSLAARELGIPRRTLVRRIESYGLPRPRKR